MACHSPLFGDVSQLGRKPLSNEIENVTKCIYFEIIPLDIGCSLQTLNIQPDIVSHYLIIKSNPWPYINCFGRNIATFADDLLMLSVPQSSAFYKYLYPIMQSVR